MLVPLGFSSSFASIRIHKQYHEPMYNILEAQKIDFDGIAFQESVTYKGIGVNKLVMMKIGNLTEYFHIYDSRKHKHIGWECASKG
jgi:hypothetical protein